MYLHWLSRDYTQLTIARGDHLRAFFSVRAYARRSQWRGFTEARRSRRRQRTAEMLAWRERRRASMIPQPWQPVAEFDRLADQPWTKTAQAVADAAHAAGMTPAAFVAAAYGAMGDQPHYAGHAQPPQPQPWSDEDHATITNRLPSPRAGWVEVAPGHHVRLRG